MKATALLFVALAVGTLGCQSDSGSLSKEDVKLGKADGTVFEKLCLAAGQPADCDVCELQGWYGDGECDGFCPQPDSADCVADIAGCEQASASYQQCRIGGEDVATCLPNSTSAESEFLETCCASLTLSVCDDFWSFEACHALEGDFDTCVFDTEFETDATKDEAELSCAASLEPAIADCCDDGEYVYCDQIPVD